MTAAKFARLSRSGWVLLLLALLAACAGQTSRPLPPTAFEGGRGLSSLASATPPAAIPSPSALLPPPLNPTDTAAPPTATLPPPTPTQEQPTRFAVIGDFGGNGPPELQVSELVKSWSPEFVITVGDNNYPNGAAETIDDTIGQYYSEFIYPYVGKYGEGAPQNRFFPTLGNHDWNTAQALPYLDYFTLPGNERYYDFTWGPVHFFAVDADSREPDGVSAGSVQAAWLQAGLAASQSPWNVVYFHQPPYSSGLHGSVDWMRWPFKEWGASVVLSGHDHTYERLEIDGLTYFVNGVGGGAIYEFRDVLPGSQVRFRDAYGAMLVTATSTRMDFQFITVQGQVIDSYSLAKP